MDKDQVRVGVAIFVFNDAGQFLVGQRKGSHGAGTWGLPGGHIEFGELTWQAAHREVMEETGMSIATGSMRQLGWTESFFEAQNKHYVTALCTGVARSPQVPRIVEPTKCAEWRWVDAATLPTPLFLPLETHLLVNLVPIPYSGGAMLRSWMKS